MRTTPTPGSWIGPVLSLGCCFAFASADDSVSVRALPSSSVYASSLQQPESPAVLEIDPRSFDGSGLSLADILASQAGIQTRRTGGMGSYQSVSIRGMGSNQVVVCIDGVPVTSGHGGSVDLGSMDLSQFARIEVYKGQVPARFGGNGTAGAINLVTHRAGQKKVNLHASYGSHSSHELALQVGAPWSDSLHISSALSQRGSANDYEFTDRNGTLYNTADDFTARRRNAEFQQWSGNHSLRRVHAGGGISQLTLGHRSERAGLPGRESSQTVTAGTQRDEARLHYQWESSPDTRWQPGAETYARVVRSSMNWYYPLDKIGLATDAAMESGVLAQGGGARFSLHHQRATGHPYFLSLYLEGAGERLLSRDYSSRFELKPWELGHSQGQLALHSGLGIWHWLRIEGEGTYRLSRDHFSGGTMNSALFDNVPSSDVYRHLASGRAALEVGPQEAPWRIFLSTSRYFRAPEPLEIYGVGGGLLPNPDLQPETGTLAELGGSLRTRHSRVSLNFFVNRAERRVVWVTSGNLSKPFNIGSSRNKGVELQMGTEPWSWLDLQANATWQNPRDASGSAAYHDKILPDEPLQAYALTTTLRLPATLFVQWIGESRSRLYRDRANRERIPAQQFHHLTLGASPWKGGRLRLSALNLGDAEYQNIFSAYPTPGRQYFASLTQEF